MELEPVAFSAAGLLAVKPVGWQEVNSGTYVRHLNALDSTGLIYDAAPLSEADFLQAIQAQIRLPEPIESSGVRATESFTWALSTPLSPRNRRLASLCALIVAPVATEYDMKTTRFVVGLILVAASVLMILAGDGDFTVPGASAIGILGIVLIAISRRR